MLVRSVGSKSTDPTTANAILPSWYELGAWQFGDLVYPDSDGSFSASFPAGSDRCMLLLVDTTQTVKLDQIVGYIAIGIDSEHNLLNFPVNEATDDINLGSVSQDTYADQSDEVKSDECNVESVTSTINMTLQELKQMASNDPLLKSIKNWYANINGDDWHGLNATYMYFYYDLAAAAGSYISPDIVFDPANSGNLEKEYTILYMTTVAEDDPTKPEFGDSELSLYLPSGTYTINAKDQNEQSVTIPAGARLSIDPNLNEPADTLSGYDFWEGNGLGFFYGTVPEGQWILKKDGVEIARYELKTLDPLYDNRNIKVFSPGIKLNTTTEGVVNSVDIKWYLYDSDSSSYGEVDPNSKAFLNVVEYLSVTFSYYGETTVSEEFEVGSNGGTTGGNLNITDTNIEPSEYTWTLSSTPEAGQTQLTSLSITYEVYGTRFTFDYRLSGTN